MSKKTLYVLGIVVTIILGTFLYLKFCCNCCVEPPTAEPKMVETTPVGDVNFVPFNISGDGFDYHTNKNLKFLKNSETIVIPVSDSVTLGIEKLKTFLTGNTTEKVLITGYATSDEKNTSTYENLGLARAHNIKDYFVAQGMLETQFDTKGEIIDSWKTDLDTLLGPAEYKLMSSTEATPVTDEWAALKTKINASPLILYFDTNKSHETLTIEERSKVDDIMNYLKNVPDAVITAVGHTDNVGNSDSNIILGQKRADFVKNYLAKNGIDSSKIETSSKGQDEPVADNSTKEGQASNRRTVITIK